MLLTEIEQSQRLVRTDAYQMSIGEVVNLYKEGDLIINPNFQRLFRWELGQKSKLIESLLLGIPLPPIFVFETADSKWELIDGLQRLSTILEFMGLLSSEGIKSAPSCLEATKYLPSLSNVVWEKSEDVLDVPIDEQNPLDKSLQLAIRRARLGVEILKRPSDNNTKYDLFQRLNSAGTPANPQELRNCVIIMVNADYYTSLKKLGDLNAFREVTSVNEEQVERQKHMEYASRFLTHTYIHYDGKLDVEEFIDDGMMQLAAAGPSTEAEHTFNKTFETLYRLFGANALRRIENGSHTGRIGLAALEAIAIGIARNLPAIEALKDPDEFIKRRVTEFWQSTEIDRFFAPGLRGTTRLQRTLPFGEAWFKP